MKIGIDARRLLLPEASLSHSSAIVSASLLLAALLGAGQALLVVLIIGEGNATDAFLAGYSIYFVFAVFGGSLRASVVPLLGHSDSDEHLRDRAQELLPRIRLVALVALALLVLVAPLAGQILTHGLPADDRWTAVLTALILAPAAFIQVEAAAAAATLTSARRFSFSASLYVASGLVALGSSALLLELVGVLGGALGLLAGALVLAGGHRLYLRSFGLRLRTQLASLRERKLWELALALVAGASLGICLQVNLAISLGTLSGDLGEITAYSYAYFLAMMVLTISSLPLGLVTLPELVSRIAREGERSAERHLLRVTPYSLAVVAPLLLAYVADGRPLLEAIFANSLSASTIDLLYELGIVLCAMAVPASLMLLGGMVALALGRWRQYLLVSVAGIAIHAAIVIPLSSLGPRAVSLGQLGSVTIIALAVLSISYRRRVLAVVAEALRRSVPAFAFATVFLVLRLPLESDPGWAAAAASAAAGLLVYVALSVRFWPSVSTAFVDLVRRPARST